jgi:hypothetical protein
MIRDVQPELLDSLPPDDPAAVHSRRDLRRINGWMNSAGFLARAVLENAPVRTLVELGCGDATLALKVVRRLPPPPGGGRIVLLDQHPVATEETLAAFRAAGWTPEMVTADVFEWLEASPIRADAILANLFLHHFRDDALRRLLRAAASRARCFVSLDPRRGRWPLFGCRMLRLIGCNSVTRNDARISVVAGFNGSDLSRLWPEPSRWQLSETSAGLFSHRFLARRLER